MNTLRYFPALCIALLLFTSCTRKEPKVQSEEVPIEERIIGKWNSYDTPERRLDIEFEENGNYNYYYNHELQTERIYNGDRSSQLLYKIIKENGKNQLLVYGKGSEKLLKKHIIEIHNDKLHIVSYKMGRGIEHHIDEYYILDKVENTEHELEEPKVANSDQIEIYFPKGYSGWTLIAFDDDYGYKARTNKNGVEVLHIPANGMLRTKSRVKPFAFTKEEVAYFIENEDGAFEEIELAYGDRNGGELKNKDLSADKVYVLNYGFNQIARHMVEHKFYNSEVQNDVLFLGIGTPEELVKVWPAFIEAAQ